MSGVRKSSPSSRRVYRDRFRFQHWYRDHQVYFITARVRDKQPAFATERAKAIFWNRFTHYTAVFNFMPWITSLLDNHYHTIGYLQSGTTLGTMMQRIHGSVAKLVNDTLSQRHVPFWGDAKDHGYFDGCLRDEKQYRLAYRHVRTQAVRHGIVAAWRDYPHTRVTVELEDGLRFALERKAFLFGVPYRRYGHGG